ncbi:MAG: methyltransferase domain-containing protein [Ruminococcaceae bacterium]|nr:methyltransferase domain-containing protein [Oscillospiraceae bacterium]
MKEEVFGSIRFRAGDGFPLSTDTVLLSAFARCGKNARVCDLGAGSGALSLQLLSREASLYLTGVELLPQAVQAAEENIARNSLQDHFRVLQGDLREIRDLLPAGSFNCCVSNPPYFPSGSGAVREGEVQATATSEAGCTLDELFAAADWLLQWGGRFSLVHRPERLTDLFCTARFHRLEPKRVRMVCHRPGAIPNLVLLECIKGGKTGLQFEPTLYLHDETGSMSAEVRTIYRKED